MRHSTPVWVFLSLTLLGQAVFSTGQGFQFSVISVISGICQIVAGPVREAGCDMGKINPKNIKGCGIRLNIFPQPRKAAQINALREPALRVRGQEDVLKNSDCIIFTGNIIMCPVVSFVSFKMHI